MESTIDLLVFNPDKIDEIKKIKNVKKVYSFKNKIDNLVAEDLVNCLKQIATNYKYIIAPSGTFSKNFIPRLAANLDLFDEARGFFLKSLSINPSPEVCMELGNLSALLGDSEESLGYFRKGAKIGEKINRMLALL